MTRKRLDEVEITGALAERILPNGKRAIKLRKKEREELQEQRLIESVVAMFLDLETGHSWEEIARELNIPMIRLKDITKSEEFMEVYSQHFAELGHDPRLRASQQAISDMLPSAIRELRTMVTSSSTAPTTKLNAIKLIMQYSGVETPKPGMSDRKELREFLKESGINIENVNIQAPPVPMEYREIVDQANIIDGTAYPVEECPGEP